MFKFRARSAAGDDFYDLQFIARLQLAPGKFGWCDGLTVVLHDHAARQQFLRDQKRLNRTRQFGGG